MAALEAQSGNAAINQSLILTSLRAGSMRKTIMEMPRHPDAFREARALVNEHDGSAEEMVTEQLEHSLEAGDVDQALKLDQVRRGIERIYEVEGR